MTYFQSQRWKRLWFLSFAIVVLLALGSCGATNTASQSTTGRGPITSNFLKNTMERTCKVEPRLCKSDAADLTPNESADIHRARLKFNAAVKTATQAGNELNDLLYAALKARKMDDDHLPASVRGEKNGEGMAFLTDDEHQHGMGTWGTCRGQIAFVNDKIIVFTPDPEIDKCESDLNKLRNN